MFWYHWTNFIITSNWFSEWNPWILLNSFLRVIKNIEFWPTYLQPVSSFFFIVLLDLLFKNSHTGPKILQSPCHLHFCPFHFLISILICSWTLYTSENRCTVFSSTLGVFLIQGLLCFFKAVEGCCQKLTRISIFSLDRELI